MAVLAVVAAVLVGIRGQGFGGLIGGGAYVARVPIKGIITDDPKLVAAIRKLGDDPMAHAVVIAIDSPGGSVGGGEALHDAIAAVAAKKPVVAVMGGLAASAGYMIAVPATRIFARQGTLTGSIGVFLQSADISGLLGKIGIGTEVIKSGPLKDEPSLVAPLSPQGREVLQGIVMDLYGQFVAMVAAGRHMDPAKVRELADGRPYTGQQALQLGLIDAVGGDHEARAWLEQAKSIPATLPEREVSTEGIAARAIYGSLGQILNGFWKIIVSQWVTVDLPQALWQHSEN
ncbi:MAG TPA: signal peptide peptidase SppA [Acetobacteraceae bacterium]|nr:signal peptide peptidase SppA [Acetobacteraceae bacterium]